MIRFKSVFDVSYGVYIITYKVIKLMFNAMNSVQLFSITVGHSSARYNEVMIPLKVDKQQY